MMFTQDQTVNPHLLVKTLSNSLLEVFPGPLSSHFVSRSTIRESFGKTKLRQIIVFLGTTKQEPEVYSLQLYNNEPGSGWTTEGCLESRREENLLQHKSKTTKVRWIYNPR